MKISFCLWLSLLSLPVLGQQPIYQNYEVDSAAIPRGGMEYLTTFLQTNLRKPIKAESEGIGGRVLIKGIVEPDGRIAEVSLLKSLRPDLDREALRVFRLFNAWQPARKGGAAVRQAVMIPVLFTTNTPFPYENGKRIYYFDGDRKLTTDAVTAKYKQEMPLDSLGVPNGDMVIYTVGSKGWVEDNRLPIVREKSTNAGKSVEDVGYRDADKMWVYNVYEINAEGVIRSVTYYEKGRQVGQPIRYHDNGSLAEVGRKDNEQTIVTSWYPTGQIHQVRVDQHMYLDRESPSRVMAHWNADGKQVVTNGTGTVTYESMRRSYADTARQTRYVEQGAFLDGKQQGRWTGAYEDGSYGYEEQYDKGVLQSGKSHKGSQPPISYTVREQQPEFAGGMPGLSSFLARNLRYPVDAQKSGQEGKVYISFVVCTDGTLCDYEVLKGVSSSLNWEALRVVKAMSGKWKPGSLRGEPVRVKYNLPINFALE